MTTATCAAPAAARQAPSPWIVGPRFDLTFFIGSGLLGFLVLGVRALIPAYATLLLCALISICLDQVHVFHTFTRTYLDRTEFGRARRFYVLTAVVVFLTFTGAALLGMGYALSLILYASAWHQAKQHYGFVKLYDRRRPASSLGAWDTWIDNFCLFGGIFSPVLYIFRLQDLGEVDRRLLTPHVPVPWAMAVMGVVAVGFLAMAFREIYRHWRFGEIAWQKCLVIVMASGLVLAAAALATELIVILVAITSFHATQYIAITWLYNRNKYAEGFSPENPVTSRLVQKRWRWLYFATGIIYGAIVVGLQRVDLLVPLAYTMTGVHFVVDARIWKVKYCPDIRAHLRAPSSARA
ncbi:MAG: hypothetical protein ACT4PV_05775 [Planctomycetaceae bacterium]